jgi:methyl-accepting chemotaxis protein
MNASAEEVVSGTALTQKSGAALTGILETSDQSRVSGEAIAAAAVRMSQMASDLVTSMDRVLAVVEENTASTEEMAAASGEVTQSIEAIASVSEENSAAVEEVSASAEEMSAQVEEVSASAQSLAEMADGLQRLVEQFNLGESRHAAMRPSAPKAAVPYVGLDRRASLLQPQERAVAIRN